MTELLLVEDDDTLSGPLARALRREGYQVQVEVDGLAALERAERETPDLVILDLGLPRMDGLEVCQRMRQNGVTIPVLILTARGYETDIVVGLDVGADDYVTKPFRLAELLARVRVLLRRPTEGREHADGPVVIDVGARRAFVEGRELSLTTKEFALLKVLLREEGRTVTREELMREVWHPWTGGSTKTLDMHVSVLRHKLEDEVDHPHHIVTVRGIGFRFQNEPDPASGKSSDLITS
ncbi:MAG: response regulator transcription factor [Ornithinimicrobium sp.]|uniref:response regulator transcription factor n=1 Tax=Ornithinimicrobium sp. TaxID=1977084 RepID=UPI001823C5B0|nr:response regulator transcription factor [Actinomycetota bacterium]